MLLPLISSLLERIDGQSILPKLTYRVHIILFEFDQEMSGKLYLALGMVISSIQSCLSGSRIVERQAQHRSDRLKKPRTKSVGTDRLGRGPDRLGLIG